MTRSILFTFSLVLSIAIVAQQPGDLDSSFAVNGKLVLELHDLGPSEIVSQDQLTSPYIVITDEMKIVVAYRQVENDQVWTRIVRLDQDGSLDPSFGLNGIATSIDQGILKELVQFHDGKLMLLMKRKIQRRI